MQYVGIDITKRKHAVCWMDETGQVLRKGVSITNDQAGFQQLQTWLQADAGAVQIGL